ncbi:OsmC family protein [Romeria aff. gracilis LEGE 07310]|uniref:OsmC family protein n=1 Tax=Vasconcelosia minhoensis LEGE 07310 TaxID=915328 RepID=A0A8J7AV01_9CYAN|nr:OsmC family protein [Romeria gracilis]MBE9075972.1 OsmC family protein [Romeria aff. gracilis LEGE 07310]
MVGQKAHRYSVQVVWTGNTGQGTASYRDYARSHEIRIEGKPVITGSADPAFRGDKTKHNPEELLVASLSSCHMLWYLHLCAEASVIVVDYQDQAVGTMVEVDSGSGRFSEVILRPAVTVSSGSEQIKAERLHEQAHHLCFIANSVNFPVRCEPTMQAENAV